jgi:serine/threonine-protein phosphatase 6 regulatory subunit 3
VLDRSPEEVKSQITLAPHFMKINGIFLSKKPIEVRPSSRSVLLSPV